MYLLSRLTATTCLSTFLSFFAWIVKAPFFHRLIFTPCRFSFRHIYCTFTFFCMPCRLTSQSFSYIVQYPLFSVLFCNFYRLLYYLADTEFFMNFLNFLYIQHFLHLKFFLNLLRCFKLARQLSFWKIIINFVFIKWRRARKWAE